jgi:hypothetical protein
MAAALGPSALILAPGRARIQPNRWRARAAGAIVLAGSLDKPHGLREAYILDDDGSVWVPCRAL